MAVPLLRLLPPLLTEEAILDERPRLTVMPTWSGWSLGLTPGRVLSMPSARALRRARCRRQAKRALSPPRQREIAWPTPFAPQRLAGMALDGQVRLSWAPVGSADVYAIKRSLSPGGPYEAIGQGVRLTRGTNPTVTPGTTYYYVVTASNAAGESPDSPEISVYVPAPSELWEGLAEAAGPETHRERAERLARLELARLEMPRPWGGTPEKARSLFAQQRLTMGEIALGKLLSDDQIPRQSFPACVEETGPCYFARCRHHLMTDVNRFGSLKISFPGWDVDEVPATCSIREARKGRRTVEEIAEMFNLTPEAVRMVELDARRKAERLIDPQRLWRWRKREVAS